MLLVHEPDSPERKCVFQRQGDAERLERGDTLRQDALSARLVNRGISRVQNSGLQSLPARRNGCNDARWSRTNNNHFTKYFTRFSHYHQMRALQAELCRGTVMNEIDLSRILSRNRYLLSGRGGHDSCSRAARASFSSFLFAASILGNERSKFSIASIVASATISLANHL